MADNPLVSVIVPTHNRPNFLQKTLHSILQQTYSHIEVFIVSNGFSTENSKIVESLKDNRLIYIEQKNSGGPASPRNHGIRLAKGEYIAFCDDDDLWMPEKLEKQINALKYNYGYGVCYSKMLRFDEKKEWVLSNEEGQADFQSLLYNNTVPISSVILEKSLINSLGGFNEAKKVGISEDYEFLLRYSLYTKFLFIDEYLIKYWSGNNRTTFSNPSISELLNQFCGILGCYYELWKNTSAVPLKKLLCSSFYQLWLILKIFAYQLFVKLEIKK